MININTKIIILAIIALFLSGFIVIALLNLNRNKIFWANNNLNNIKELTNNQQNKNINMAPEEKITSDQNIAINIVSPPDYLQELKNKHPELSEEQLKFYSETAAKGNILPCFGKIDESSCISAVAYILKNNNFCGEIKDYSTRIECLMPIVKEKASAEINQCISIINDDLKISCLVNIFEIYKQISDCSFFQEVEVKNMCESVVYYHMAIEKGSKLLCALIKNEEIKDYCNK